MSSSNPRNDAALLDMLLAERDCVGFEGLNESCSGPTWWGCERRGCYEHGKLAYGDTMRKRDQERGYDANTNGPDDREFEQTARGRQKWNSNFNA